MAPSPQTGRMVPSKRPLAESPANTGTALHTCTRDGCTKQFTKRSGLLRHIASIHEGVKHACPFHGCSAEYTDRSALLRHIASIHEGVKHACSFDGCSAEYTDRANLLRHIASIHEGVKHACPFHGCSAEYTDRSHLLTHIASIHEGVKHACSFDGCSAEFTTRSHLLTHIASIHEGVKHACSFEECSAQFTHRSCLLRHIRTVHNEEYQRIRVKEEEVISQALTSRIAERPFGGWLATWKPQLFVDFTCINADGASRDRSFVDFHFPHPDEAPRNGLLVHLEVDESQHAWYGQSCESKRMYDTCASLQLANPALQLNTVWIRYNPHGFKVDGETKRTMKAERHAKLFQLMDELAAEEPGMDTPPVRVVYMFYDTLEGRPVCLDEAGYHDEVKKWYWKCVV